MQAHAAHFPSGRRAAVDQLKHNNYMLQRPRSAPLGWCSSQLHITSQQRSPMTGGCWASTRCPATPAIQTVGILTGLGNPPFSLSNAGLALLQFNAMSNPHRQFPPGTLSCNPPLAPYLTLIFGYPYCRRHAAAHRAQNHATTHHCVTHNGGRAVSKCAARIIRWQCPPLGC